MAEEAKLPPVVLTKLEGGEAPAIAFTQLFWNHGDQVGQINVTCRANTPIEAIEMLWQGAIEAKKRYGITLTDPSIIPAPKKIADTPPVNQRIANAEVNDRPAAPPTARVSAPQGDNNGIIQSVKLVVEPKPIEAGQEPKVTLKWFASGHQYPDIYCTKLESKALELLRSTGEDWTLSMLQRAQNFIVKHNIYYRNSEKLNTNNKPYKDIVEIVTRD